MCYKTQGIPQKHQRFGGGGRVVVRVMLCPDSHSLLLLQAISISKAINTQEAPVKEKHARRILSLASPGWRGGDPVPGQEGFTPRGWSHGRFGRWQTRAELGWGMISCRFIHR